MFNERSAPTKIALPEGTIAPLAKSLKIGGDGVRLAMPGAMIDVDGTTTVNWGDTDALLRQFRDLLKDQKSPRKRTCNQPRLLFLNASSEAADRNGDGKIDEAEFTAFVKLLKKQVLVKHWSRSLIVDLACST